MKQGESRDSGALVHARICLQGALSATPSRCVNKLEGVCEFEGGLRGTSKPFASSAFEQQASVPEADDSLLQTSLEYRE